MNVEQRNKIVMDNYSLVRNEVTDEDVSQDVFLYMLEYLCYSCNFKLSVQELIRNTILINKHRTFADCLTNLYSVL